jgi:Xaa-Pro aminopeptidase
VPVARALDEAMMVKSPYEVALMRESSRWAVRAHELLQAYTAVGRTETEVSTRASADATVELAEALPGYVAGQMGGGARAGYRGQIGRRAAVPHSLGANVRFEPGDTLVTGASAPMWGYGTELERTMFVGEPGPEQRRLFAHMLALQDLCFEAIRPGVPAASVDEAMRAYFEREGLWRYWRHHVGHGLGLRYHEAPFLDRGDDTVIEAGMILSVEPGLYDADWGGFRHSDTVVVTDDGVELLTGAYPRDLDSLVIPADDAT